MTRYLSSASVLVLAALPLHAQEAFQLDPVTIYGNLAELPISRTGASIAVIEEDELETDATASLSEAISRRAGVTFTDTGGVGGLSYSRPNYVRIRGLGQAYVPVLLNGIDITDPSATQANFDWQNILSGGITRVEVVKGSQSAIYGSEAVAGVIGLTAARAPEAAGREGRAELELGAYGTRRATLGYGVAGARAGLAVTASRAVTDGFSAYSDGSDDDDGFAGTQLSFDGYVDLTPDLRIGLTGFSFRSEYDYDPGDRTGDTRQQGLRAYLQAQTGAVSHEFDLSRYIVDRDVPQEFFDKYDGERSKAGYLGSWQASDRLTLSFGGDWTKETADSFTDEEVVVRGVFAELQYAATPDIDLALSLRHDDNSQFGGFTTGRAALSWRARPDITIRASAANGFRAPSLTELYGQFGANPDLDPETSRSFDLGVEKTYAGGSFVAATLFYTEIDDLIGYTTAYNQVDGTSVSKGMEIEGAWVVSDRVTLRGAYTYTDARDAEDDPLQRVPRYALDIGIDAQITDRLSAVANVTRRADFVSTFGTGFSREEVSDYTVANAELGYTFANGTQGYLRIENLFDADYEVIPGYETSDRAAYFGIRASF